MPSTIRIISVTLLAVGVAILIRKIRSMRAIDLKSAVFTFVIKSGLLSLIRFFPVISRGESKELTASNGLKLHVFAGGCFDTLDEVLQFTVRDDDVFIVSYPKSGTTWMLETVWLIYNDVDVEKAKKLPVPHRCPFLEKIDSAGPEPKGLQTLETWPKDKQRVIKTHLPFDFLPQMLWKNGKAKIIYVVRNPKDVWVSYYHFLRSLDLLPQSVTWERFVERFGDETEPWGSWFPHCLKYWEEHKRRFSQIYYVAYESLKKNYRSEIVSLANFLGKEMTEEQIDKICDHCLFANMKNNSESMRFLRKGMVGDWKNYFTINQNLMFDRLYQQKMKETDLKLEFE